MLACRRSALRWASMAKPASFNPNEVGSAWTPCVRPTHSVPACSRARSASAAASSRAPGTITSPARRSCRASAVSSTSDEVRPKWIQRPAGPADPLRTSTKAATSWSVTASRSFTASTVKVAPRIASRSASGGPSERLRRCHLHVAPGGHPGLVGPELAELRAGVAGDHARHPRVRARAVRAGLVAELPAHAHVVLLDPSRRGGAGRAAERDRLVVRDLGRPSGTSPPAPRTSRAAAS